MRKTKDDVNLVQHASNMKVFMRERYQIDNYNPANLPAIQSQIEILPDRVILWTKGRVWSFRYLALA